MRHSARKWSETFQNWLGIDQKTVHKMPYFLGYKNRRFKICVFEPLPIAFRKNVTSKTLLKIRFYLLGGLILTKQVKYPHLIANFGLAP